jgi:hypothetical protein
MEVQPFILVFVHGLFGWGEDRDRTRWPKDYWYGVRRFLEHESATRPDYTLKILMPSLPSVDSIGIRGVVLQQAIEKELTGCPPGTRVHLIAHSRGGLDARWVIVQPGMHHKIASLTTIGTAHQGTTFIDWAYAVVPVYSFVGKLLKLIENLKRRLGMPSSELYYHFLHGYDCSTGQMRQALFPLTHKGAAVFNQVYAEPERLMRQRNYRSVSYFAYGGRLTRVRIPFLRLSHAIINWFGTSEERRSGNDGATSVWSAHYPWENNYQADGMSASVQTVSFDHYEQVNWKVLNDRSDDSLPHDLQMVYRCILQHILRINDDEHA